VGICQLGVMPALVRLYNFPYWNSHPNPNTNPTLCHHTAGQADHTPNHLRMAAPRRQLDPTGGGRLHRRQVDEEGGGGGPPVCGVYPEAVSYMDGKEGLTATSMVRKDLQRFVRN
jgi:hypothetical protein